MPHSPLCLGPTVLKNRPRMTGNPFSLVVSQRQELVQGLGTGIGPPPVRGASHHPIVLFIELVAAFPVDLGCRGYVQRRTVLVTTVQDDLRPPDVGRDGLDRGLDDLSDSHRGGQMHDTIDLADGCPSSSASSGWNRRSGGATGRHGPRRGCPGCPWTGRRPRRRFSPPRGGAPPGVNR